MLLAEDLVLLLTDDKTGKPLVDQLRRDLVLAGAVVHELTALGRLRVTDRDEEQRPGRLVVADASPTGDDLLDATLQRLAGRKPEKPKNALDGIGKGLHQRVLERLAARGILRLEVDRVLGVFPRTAWPAVDSTHEDGVRKGLSDVLVVGRAPTPYELTLIALLDAVGQVPTVLPGSDVSRRELRRRARAVAEDGGFAATAVRKALDDAIAATTVVATQ
ncbi:GPP34 family phosphoprotein [Georgenia sp. M64]|uniref:GOLPH3/VPS74 family protein n=1 Tax=Georgenia sp. M64 TaxID=3120520 RepID=UPI0030DF2D6E